MTGNRFFTIKTFKKCLMIFCMAALFSFAFTSCSKSDSLSFKAMDTFMTVKSFGKNPSKANELLKEKIIQIENFISVTNEESDVYKLNHAEKFPLSVDYNTILPLAISLNFAEKTDGALNPCLYPITKEWGFTTGNYRVPDEKTIQELLPVTDYKKIKIKDNLVWMDEGMMIDLGATGKGFAGDQGIAVLKANGIKSAILDFGGNVQCLGSKADGSDWTVGIKNPWQDGIVASVKISNMAVITSGGYERYFIGDDGKKYIHIFDPKSGKPVENNILSTTIISPHGIYADALSTATFVMGKEKSIELYKSEGDFEMIMIFDDHSILITKGLEGKFSLSDPSLSYEVVE